MRIYKDISLDEFEAWSGAVDTMDTLRRLKNETGDNVFSIIESCIDDMGEGMDETTVNDVLWFETDTIAEWLGYEDWEALERATNGESDNDGEIELLFNIGDIVKIENEKGIIIEIDKFDNNLPYKAQFINDKSHKDWYSIDEIEEWEDENE